MLCLNGPLDCTVTRFRLLKISMSLVKKNRLYAMVSCWSIQHTALHGSQLTEKSRFTSRLVMNPAHSLMFSQALQENRTTQMKLPPSFAVVHSSCLHARGCR